MGQETLGVVCVESMDPRVGPGRVGGPTGILGTGQGTLVEGRGGSGDTRRGPERVW